MADAHSMSGQLSLLAVLFSLVLPQPPSPTLFPYTTLFRSEHARSGFQWREPFPDSVRPQHAFCRVWKLHRDERHQACAGSELERSEEHTSELQSRGHLVCRLLLEKKKNTE